MNTNSVSNYPKFRAVYLGMIGELDAVYADKEMDAGAKATAFHKVLDKYTS